MHICARGIIGLVYSVFYRLNDDLARMDANSDLQIWIAKTRYPILHCQRRQTATHCVILMRLRGTEQCHDPVALRLVDDALITNNRFVHEVENRLQTSHPQFRVAQTIKKAS